MLKMSLTNLYAVADPLVTLSTPTHPLWINRTERTEITCSISLSNNTMTGLQNATFYTFIWRQMDGRRLQNDSRITIQFPSNSSSVLSLFPLSVLDNTISCDVVANTSHSNDYILASSPATANISLRINSK